MTEKEIELLAKAFSLAFALIGGLSDVVALCGKRCHWSKPRSWKTRDLASEAGSFCPVWANQVSRAAISSHRFQMRSLITILGWQERFFLTLNPSICCYHGAWSIFPAQTCGWANGHLTCVALQLAANYCWAGSRGAWCRRSSRLKAIQNPQGKSRWRWCCRHPSPDRNPQTLTSDEQGLGRLWIENIYCARIRLIEFAAFRESQCLTRVETSNLVFNHE